MKKQMWTRIISGTLACVMMTTMFGGCKSEKNSESTESTNSTENTENTEEGTASEVSYNTEGKFTTTLTAESANFREDIAVGDVKVGYNLFDEDAYQKALAEEGDVEESKVDIGDYMTEVTVSVENVGYKNEHTLEISFSDAKASENIPSSYGILISEEKSGAGKQLAASAPVEYTKYTLTPNINSVSAFDKDIRLTLELNEGSYADGISKEDVVLSGSFAGLSIDSLSSSGKNLTMQLTGEIQKDESSNTYLTGGVSLAPSAIVNNAKEATVYLPVDGAMVYLDAARLTVENGKATVPILLGGYRFSDEASADSFKLDGTEIIGFEMKSDTEGILTLNVSDAKDKNSVASALNGKTLTVSANAVGSSEALTQEADLSDAAFYPVFDYAEEKDGKYNMTLILYANAGTFAESLENGMVSFDNDFKDAADVSITRSNDTTAELKFSLPSNGVSVEEMSLNGTVKLASGTLINRWGDKAAETAYTREYSGENMGRIFTEMEIGQLKDIVGGFGNTTWGTISSVGSGIVSGATGVYTALQIVGVIESERKKLDKIYDAVCEIHEQISAVDAKLGKIQNTQYSTLVGNFYTEKLLPLSSYNDYVISLINDSMTDLKRKKNITAPGGNSDSSVSAEKWTAYLKELMPLVALNDKRGYFPRLQDYFTRVQSSVVALDAGNIIDIFDKYTTYCYNFDTLTYDERDLFRNSVKAELMRAYYLLCIYSEFSDPSSASQSIIDTFDEKYTKAGEVFKNKEVKRRTDGSAIVHSANDRLINYTLSCHVWYNNSMLSFTRDQAEDFISRMHGRTAKEELEAAGIQRMSSFSNKIKYFALDGYWEEKDYCVYQLSKSEQLCIPYTEKNPQLKWVTTHYYRLAVFKKDKGTDIYADHLDYRKK